ncbi:hypothetical protein A5699_25970 [Mycobacterium sp. E802]|uniref:hypothetical protein n=1 Tax=Mycobacterium sp. E802 TaxID=1834152 RepID=UPI0008018957|nr:hypothetical protein [Mycobacterium sp. E802]OBG84778.1 hypothetical protein A5699_25970 [Mycobacterium sp. E802]
MARKTKKPATRGPRFCPHMVPFKKENGWLGCFLCQRAFYGESIDHPPFACPNHPEVVAYRDADAEWHLDCSCDHGDYDEMAKQWSLCTDLDGKRYGMRSTDHRCPRCDAPAALVGATWIFDCGHYTGQAGVPFYRVVGNPKKCTDCPNDVPPAIAGTPWRGDKCPRCALKSIEESHV